MRLAAPADQRDEAGHLATLDITGHHVVQRARRALDKPAELILRRLSFATRLGGFDIIVFVVAPHPIGKIAVRTSRVAAFRGQIEHHVGRQRCRSSTIPRRRAHNWNRCGRCCPPHPYRLRLHPAISHLIVVVDLALRQFLWGERDVVVVLQMHKATHVVGAKGTADSTLLPPGPQHEMIDYRLATPVAGCILVARNRE